MKLAITGLILISLIGCATTGLPPESSQGVYHRVEKGETLYRISRAYRVDVYRIMKANRMSEPAQLKAGQHLFIPGAAKPIKIKPPLKIKFPRSTRWTYIVIHHSGTRVGNARRFEKMHRRRGFHHGLGYHFVICNGTAGRRDGHVRAPLWLSYWGQRWRSLRMDCIMSFIPCTCSSVRRLPQRCSGGTRESLLKLCLSAFLGQWESVASVIFLCPIFLDTFWE